MTDKDDQDRKKQYWLQLAHICRVGSLRLLRDLTGICIVFDYYVSDDWSMPHDRNVGFVDKIKLDLQAHLNEMWSNQNYSRKLGEPRLKSGQQRRIKLLKLAEAHYRAKASKKRGLLKRK